MQHNAHCPSPKAALATRIPCAPGSSEEGCKGEEGHDPSQGDPGGQGGRASLGPALSSACANEFELWPRLQPAGGVVPGGAGLSAHPRAPRERLLASPGLGARVHQELID